MSRRGARVLDLSGLPVRVEGLETPMEGLLEERWEGFWRDEEPEDPKRWFLRVTLEAPRASGTAPVPGAPFDPRGMRVQGRGEEALLELEGARASLGPGGRLHVRLARCDVRGCMVFVNFLLAATALRAPAHEALLVHGAAVLVDERAWVLVGQQGRGKTTWASQAEAGGARVLTDDLVLVRRAGDAPEVLGTPFRPLPGRRPLRGRWPLAAFLVPEWRPEPALEPAGLLEVSGRLLANLPYLAERLEDRPEALALVERLLRTAPGRRLAFAPDPAFVDLLRAADL